MRSVLFACLLFSVQCHAERPTLIGGDPVGDGDYLEVVRIRSGRSSCTATIVGPRVVMTAAHCTRNGGVITFEKNRTVYSANCEWAPDYRGEVGDQDMALCKLDREISGPYASLGHEKVKLNQEVILIGYGCTRPGGGGGNDGILRVGKSLVVRESDEEYYSFHTRGNSALCFGDSGGPVFLMADPQAHHTVVGVNSRGNIRDLSLLTAVYHANSIDFARYFESSNEVEICGISRKCDDDVPFKCRIFKHFKARHERKAKEYDDKLKECINK